MALVQAAWTRSLVIPLLVLIWLIFTVTPTFAVERPSIDNYKHDVGKVEAFLRDYLRIEWELAGPNTDDLVRWIVKYSLDNDTDPLLQLARILKESRGRHFTMNSRDERVVLRGGSGTIGFSQIHPFWIGKKVGGIVFTKEMLFDPEGNVKAGILLYKRYDNGDYMVALTHYNNPKADSPNQYAIVVNRIYLNMVALYSKYKYLPSPVANAVGTSIKIG
jgi:hypothetical protein